MVAVVLALRDWLLAVFAFAAIVRGLCILFTLVFASC